MLPTALGVATTSYRICYFDRVCYFDGGVVLFLFPDFCSFAPLPTPMLHYIIFFATIVMWVCYRSINILLRGLRRVSSEDLVKYVSCYDAII